MEYQKNSTHLIFQILTFQIMIGFMEYVWKIHKDASYSCIIIYFLFQFFEHDVNPLVSGIH